MAGKPPVPNLIMASVSSEAGPATAPYRWAYVSVRHGRSQGSFVMPWTLCTCRSHHGEVCPRARRVPRWPRSALGLHFLLSEAFTGRLMVRLDLRRGCVSRAG